MKVKILVFFSLIFMGTNICCSDIPDFEKRQSQGTVDFEILDEISGCVNGIVNKDLIWVHNDSEKPAKIYAIDKSGKLQATLVIEGAVMRDWEDIAAVELDGTAYLAIGDIGDNSSQFPTKKIFLVKEPAIDKKPFSGVAKVDRTIEFTLADDIYDSEAFFIDPGGKNIYIITKRLAKEKVYKIDYPYPADKVIKASYVAELNIGSEGPQAFGITGADISPKGDEILIRTYTSVYYFDRNQGESIDAALKREEHKLTAYDYDMGKEPQGEAVCWDASANGFYTTGEFSPFKIPPQIWFYAKSGSYIAEKKPDNNEEIYYYKGKIIVNPEATSAKLKVEIYSLTGKFLSAAEGFPPVEINAKKAGIQSGSYFIKVLDGKKLLAKKKIVIR